MQREMCALYRLFIDSLSPIWLKYSTTGEFLERYSSIELKRNSTGSYFKVKKI